ncbi:LysR substrate-binding domain-containing protein [Dongia sp.]|uniref:LysR substrate-binding domain-containing protein n=1 Tax=Dongia sp. TaxID=1977262 RepID=UPI003753AADC
MATPPETKKPAQTRMPALAALRAFEAAARLGSVRRAAEELHVTPAAVTQQIRALEADLGLAVVQKRGNALELTEAGLRGKDPLINAFRQMQQAVERMRQRKAPRRLRLSVEPAFAVNWLISRLPRYRELPNALDVLLDPTKTVVDLAGNEADLAIRFGRGHYPGLESIDLFEDEILPVCAPDYLKRHPISKPKDLVQHQLLRLDWSSREGLWPDWPAWFEAAGVSDLGSESDRQRDMTFPDSNLLLRAAVGGQGVALGQTSLVKDFIDSKQLVAPISKRLKTGFRYHLVYPLGADQRPEIALFRDWIVGEAHGK